MRTRKVPVQTFLQAHEYEAVKAIAQREGASVAAVVRRMVKRDAEFVAEEAKAKAEQEA